MTENPYLISFQFPHVKHIKIFFGTRLGGFSTKQYTELNISLEVGDKKEDVLKNRTIIKKYLNINNWQELKQIHGTNIITTNSPSEKICEGDGIFTASSNLALLIKTADCQPIFFTDIKGRFIGAIHCGWRGNVLDFPILAIKKFCQSYSILPHEIFVVRGPSLGPCCAEFINYKSEIPKKFWSFIDKNTKKLDLWSLTKHQLKQAGVLSSNIFNVDICTACNPNLFFSYRQNKICGRQGNLILKIA